MVTAAMKLKDAYSLEGKFLFPILILFCGNEPMEFKYFALRFGRFGTGFVRFGAEKAAEIP